MATVEFTETYVGCPITAGSVKSGAGLKWGVYSLTKVQTGDWIIAADFTAVYYAQACFKGNDGNTSIESCNITSVASPTRVWLGGAATGAEYLLIIGT